MSEADDAPLPAVPEPPTPAQLPAHLETLGVLPAMVELVRQIGNTQLVTGSLRGKPDEVLAVMLAGHELGIPPMQSVRGDLYVIDGKVGTSSELQRALVARSGHRLDVEENTDTVARITGTRADTGSTATVTFTIEDAKRAGLTGRSGGSWSKYPRAMLLARATSELCRLLFADVLRGASYTPEELSSIAPHRDIVPTTIVDHDWSDLGWTDQAEHDGAMNAVRRALGDAPSGVRDDLLAEWTSRGLAWPLARDDLAAWVAVCADHGVIVGRTEPAGPTTDPESSDVEDLVDIGFRLGLTDDETREIAETILDRPVPDLTELAPPAIERVRVELLARLAEETGP